LLSANIGSIAVENTLNSELLSPGLTKYDRKKDFAGTSGVSASQTRDLLAEYIELQSLSFFIGNGSVSGNIAALFSGSSDYNSVNYSVENLANIMGARVQITYDYIAQASLPSSAQSHGTPVPTPAVLPGLIALAGRVWYKRRATASSKSV
jgi:hypothetical protein